MTGGPATAVVVVGDVPASRTGLEDGPYNWPPRPLSWLSQHASDVDALVVVGDAPGLVIDALSGNPGAAVPVVVVGDHGVAARVALLTRGVHDVVAAPVDTAELAVRLTGAVRTRQLGKRLDAALAQAQDANRRLERFAYSASHDLREPLRAVSGFAKLLDERYADVLDDAGKTYLSFIVEGSNRLASMIQALLELSRLSRRQIRPLEVSPAAAVKRVLEGIESELAATGTTVEVSLDALPPIVTDQAMLEVCLHHLLSNAAKFVSPDRDPFVTVTGEVVRDWMNLTVEDNGIGVAEEDFKRVFDMFSRLHGREDFDGHGIGLGLVSLVAERLGGGVSIDAEPGEGARVTLRLPTAGPPGVDDDL